MHGERVFYCNLCDFRTNEPGNYEAYEKILEHIHSAHPEEIATKDHDSAPHILRKWWQWFRKEKEEKVEMKAGTGNVMFVKSSTDSASEPKSEAAKWYLKAAEQGLAFAQGDLGVMYYEGIGVPQDYSEAAKWYCKAAEQGLPEAQYFLGVMYHNGQGVPQDYVLAYMWLNLAALRFPASEKKNREMANKDRDITASEMTLAQIVEAQKLAREWKPKELGREKVKDQEKKTEKESAMEIWQREDR
jgi:TPR repeat protein